MNTTVLLSIAFGLVSVSLIAVLVKVFRDKKVSEDERKVLQDIIIESLKETIAITGLKTEDEMKTYCVGLVMKKLNENNIQGIDEKTVLGALELLLKLNNKISEELEKRKTENK